MHSAENTLLVIEKNALYGAQFCRDLLSPILGIHLIQHKQNTHGVINQHSKLN